MFESRDGFRAPPLTRIYQTEAHISSNADAADDPGFLRSVPARLSRHTAYPSFANALPNPRASKFRVGHQVGLDHHGSTATVKFLGVFAQPAACRDACTANSTGIDPCHSWAFYYPDTPQEDFRGACYGRHDRVFDPQTGIPRSRNHVCTAVSCHYPVPPSPPLPPKPPPPPAPPFPPHPPPPVDPALAPVAYLGGVDGDGTGPMNFTLACRFQ
eukprot:gene1939-2983_t